MTSGDIPIATLTLVCARVSMFDFTFGPKAMTSRNLLIATVALACAGVSMFDFAIAPEP